MTTEERDRFDALLEEALGQMPQRVREVIEEIPLVVDDQPEPELARDLYDEHAQARGLTLEEYALTLCGLHTGVPLTERSVSDEHRLPTEIRIFRQGIVHTAGGWEPKEGESAQDVDDVVYEEIVITILHEIGHHFGLEEEDLEALGYD